MQDLLEKQQDKYRQLEVANRCPEVDGCSRAEEQIGLGNGEQKSNPSTERDLSLNKHSGMSSNARQNLQGGDRSRQNEVESTRRDSGVWRYGVREGEDSIPGTLSGGTRQTMCK